MSIFNFIEKMSPVMKKTNIQDDLAHTKKILDEVSLPAANSFASSLAILDNDNAVINSASDTFYTLTKHKGRNFGQDLESTIRNARNNLNFVEKELNKEISDESYRDALNLRHAQLFQASAGLALIADLSIAAFCTLMQSMMDKKPVEKDFSKKFRKLVKLLNSYGTEPRFFEATFKRVPDVVITEDNARALRAAYAKDGDPYEGFDEVDGFLPHPVFFLRSLWADYLIARYESQKKRKKKFELLVLALAAQRAGEPTAALESQISYYEDQIQKLADKIEAFETRYR